MVICVTEAHAAAPQRCNLTQGFVYEAKLTELFKAHERENYCPDYRWVTLWMLFFKDWILLCVQSSLDRVCIFQDMGIWIKKIR